MAVVERGGCVAASQSAPQTVRSDSAVRRASRDQRWQTRSNYICCWWCVPTSENLCFIGCLMCFTKQHFICIHKGLSGLSFFSVWPSVLWLLFFFQFSRDSQSALSWWLCGQSAVGLQGFSTPHWTECLNTWTSATQQCCRRETHTVLTQVGSHLFCSCKQAKGYTSTHWVLVYGCLFTLFSLSLSSDQYSRGRDGGQERPGSFTQSSGLCALPGRPDRVSVLRLHLTTWSTRHGDTPAAPGQGGWAGFTL